MSFIKLAQESPYLALACIFGIHTILYFVLMAYSTHKVRRREQYVMRATGEVVDFVKFTQTMTVVYQDAGLEYKKNFTVPAKYEVEKGQKVEVRYDENNPKQSFVVGVHDSGAVKNRKSIYIYAAFTLLAALIFLYLHFSAH